MWAPDTIKLSISSGDPGNRATYAALRSAVMQLINGNITFSGAGLPSLYGDPMQVDAVNGKGNGKGKKGKDKNGKGKDKGGKVKGKNEKKGADKGKQKGTTVRFDGYCRGCDKYGHKLADCWSAAKNKDKMHVDQATYIEELPQVGAVRTSDSHPVSYTLCRAHETGRNLVCRLLLGKKNKKWIRRQ